MPSVLSPLDLLTLRLLLFSVGYTLPDLKLSESDESSHRVRPASPRACGYTTDTDPQRPSGLLLACVKNERRSASRDVRGADVMIRVRKKGIVCATAPPASLPRSLNQQSLTAVCFMYAQDIFVSRAARPTEERPRRSSGESTVVRCATLRTP